MNAWFPRITGHSLVVALSLLTYVLTTRAERERRPPSVAIAWVLGLIALPYLALPSYLLFGRRKLPRKVSPWSFVAGSISKGSHRAMFSMPEPLLFNLWLNGARFRSVSPRHHQSHPRARC